MTKEKRGIPWRCQIFGHKWKPSHRKDRIARGDTGPPTEPVRFAEETEALTPSQIGQVIADNCEPCDERCGHLPEKASECVCTKRDGKIVTYRQWCPEHGSENGKALPAKEIER